MLNDFVAKNKSLVRWIIIGLIGLIIIFNFIALIGSYSNASGSNAAITFNFIANAALLGILLYCMLGDKTDLAKAIGFIYLAYYVISTLLGIGNPFSSFYDGNHGTFVAAATFMLIANLIFLGVVVMGILTYLNGQQFGIVVDVMLLAYLFFNFMAWILYMAGYAVYEYRWTSFMNLTVSRILTPALVVLGYLYLNCKEGSKDEKLDDMSPDQN